MNPVYNVNIQKVNTLEGKELKERFSDFKVRDQKINGKVLNLLVEYSSTGDPEIEAYWDGKSVYLVGGKTDSPKIEEKGNFFAVQLAKRQQAWIKLNLEHLGNNITVQVYRKVRPVYAREAREDGSFDESRYDRDPKMITSVKI